MKIGKPIVPPLKSQGIKTKLVPWISASLPNDIGGKWIEPFLGSGVVFLSLAPQRALLADSNPHIINFYKAVASRQLSPSLVREYLEDEGAELLRTNGDHYYVIRQRFNDSPNPLDFLFLTRACFNGVMRFNKSGKFNVPFCRKPSRFSKAYITKVVNQVRDAVEVLQAGEYDLVCQDFATTIQSAEPQDFIYCDPPYIARHTDFYGSWDIGQEELLVSALSRTGARFLLSTWHSNAYRKNAMIDLYWSKFAIETAEHFYHVGASEKNRNPMREALVANYPLGKQEVSETYQEQPQLFERAGPYSSRVLP